MPDVGDFAAIFFFFFWRALFNNNSLFFSARIRNRSSLLPSVLRVPVQDLCPTLVPVCTDGLSQLTYSCTHGPKRGHSLFQSCSALGSGKQTWHWHGHWLFTWCVNKNDACHSLLPFILHPSLPFFPACSFYCIRLIECYFHESKPAKSFKNLARNCYCDSIFQILPC